MEEYILAVNCEAVPLLKKSGEAAFIFIGGFDAPTRVNDIAQASSFLCVTYPVSNYEELAKQIGSIDIAQVE